MDLVHRTCVVCGLSFKFTPLRGLLTPGKKGTNLITTMTPKSQIKSHKQPHSFHS